MDGRKELPNQNNFSCLLFCCFAVCVLLEYMYNGLKLVLNWLKFHTSLEQFSTIIVLFSDWYQYQPCTKKTYLKQSDQILDRIDLKCGRIYGNSIRKLDQFILLIIQEFGVVWTDHWIAKIQARNYSEQTILYMHAH